MRLLHWLSVLLVLGVLLTAACSGGGQSSSKRSSAAKSAAPATSSAVAADGRCAAQPPDTALPTWARGGFSDPAGPVPHVLGARGNIVAILWARTDALHAPPLAGRSNKILWVSKLPPGGPLVIRATLAGSGQTVDREVAGGPGPSIINLPAAGCWTMDLSWSGHTDQVKLRYVS
jgi:hypothetical protein